jgi:hypothetical protein
VMHLVAAKLPRLEVLRLTLCARRKFLSMSVEYVPSVNGPRWVALWAMQMLKCHEHQEGGVFRIVECRLTSVFSFYNGTFPADESVFGIHFFGANFRKCRWVVARLFVEGKWKCDSWFLQ